MIVNNLGSKYQIPKFLLFFSKYKFVDGKAKHTASIAAAYYIYAYYQYISYTETYVEFFKVDEPSHDQIGNYLSQSWSHAFGMYTLLRTALEALSHMRKMIGDTLPVDSYYENGIRDLCNIANDLVKHPTFNPEDIFSEAAEPQALGIDGTIDFVIMSDLETFKEKISRRPSSDFDLVHDYFEYIGERFLASN